MCCLTPCYAGAASNKVQCLESESETETRRWPEPIPLVEDYTESLQAIREDLFRTFTEVRPRSCTRFTRVSGPKPGIGGD